jgi:hypothetical protein
MPFKSKAQQAWAHTPEGMKKLGGALKVAEWDSATAGKGLPDRIKKVTTPIKPKRWGRS